jgi:hypothetical protein
VIQLLDVAALWLIWWCAAAGAIAGHGRRGWRERVLTMGLIVVMVTAFVGAISLYVEPRSIRWWASGLVYGVAIVAVCWYDERFGIGRHLRMVRAWLSALAQRG